MRLTLRTLLAWLDNVLPPEGQKELGDKVTASVSAQHLVERIRRIVERPTVSAPRIEGKGLAADANSVAEYLDNRLEPERLEAFERICVESDVHLAEVAACHNILASMAADPHAAAPLDAAGRARLLAAMRHHSASAVAEAEQQESLANARAVQTALRSAAKSPVHQTAHEDTVLFDARQHTLPSTPRPEPTRRSSRGAWAAALTAVGLLAVLGILLVQSIVGGQQRRVAVKPDAAGVASAPAAEAPPRDAGEAQPPAAEAATAEPPHPQEALPMTDDLAQTRPEPEAAAEAPEQPAVEPVAAQPPEEPIEVEVAPTVPPAAAAVAAPEQPRVPLGDALAIAAPVPAPPVQPSATQTTPEKPSVFDAAATPPTAAAAPAVGFVGGGGLLLHKALVNGAVVNGAPADGAFVNGTTADGQRSWVAFPPGKDLGEREDLLVPPGFHPDVNVRGVTIRLLPGTRATLSLDADGTPRIEVVFGRAVARASRADARLGVTAGGLVGTITAGLVEPVAIEVELQRSAGVDPEQQPSRIRAGITAVAGGLVWRQSESTGETGGGSLAGIAKEGMLDARAAIRWDSLEPAAATLQRQAALPPWIESAPHLDKLEKGACEAMEARVAATTPLTTALRELAADKRAENRMLAVSTLALLGEYDELVELLSADGPGRKLEGRQWLAVESMTVPLALARGTTAAGRLRKAFEDRAPHGKSEMLYMMAKGFTDADLAAGADAALVEALADPDLVVRRYAIKCLCDIVQPTAADRLRYRPDGLPDLRREGVNWWRGQLEKGLVRRTAARE